jgi:hypothetical protein
MTDLVLHIIICRLRKTAPTEKDAPTMAMEVPEKIQQSVLSRAAKRNTILCLAFVLIIRISGIEQWAPTPPVATNNGKAPTSENSLPVPTNITAITASTKQKIVFVQANDSATMVLPKEAESQTTDFQNAAAYQSYNSSKSTNSSNISHSVPDAISMKPNISCSLHATGNFTRFAVPRALANYSGFLTRFQNQSLDSSLLGKDDAAICDFHSRFSKYWKHFPHTMQQLYSCISWWNGHPSHPSVLAWSSKVHEEQLRSDRFVGGIIKSLANNHNVTFLDLDTRPAPNNTVSLKPSSVSNFGYIVQSPTHLHEFRDATVQDLFPGRVRLGCPTNTTTNRGDSASPRIGILNRRKTRRLQTVDILVHELGQAFPMSSITITEFESANFADQVDFFSSVDILISPHGAQLTGLPFMPNCGGLVELFPKGYHIPNFFGSLAIASGLDYGYVYMSGGNATNEAKAMSATKPGRAKARRINLCPESKNIVDAVRVLIDDWYQCCNRAAV